MVRERSGCSLCSARVPRLLLSRKCCSCSVWLLHNGEVSILVRIRAVADSPCVLCCFLCCSG